MQIIYDYLTVIQRLSWTYLDFYCWNSSGSTMFHQGCGSWNLGRSIAAQRVTWCRTGVTSTFKNLWIDGCLVVVFWKDILATNYKISINIYKSRTSSWTSTFILLCLFQKTHRKTPESKAFTPTWLGPCWTLPSWHPGRCCWIPCVALGCCSPKRPCIAMCWDSGADLGLSENRVYSQL